MRAKWDRLGERFYQTGVDRGMLYSYIEDEYSNGTPWNGLISVRVGPTGSTAYDGKLYRRSVKVGVEQSFNEYNGKITCFTYPDEFEPCIGYVEIIPGMYASQQDRPLFGLSFRTLIGNDVDGVNYGYRLHLVYNCLVTTSDGEAETVGEDGKAIELMYDIETFPVETDLLENPSSEIIFDSRKLTTEQLSTLEDILYGTEESEPRLPYPDELVEILREAGGLDKNLYPGSDLQPSDELYPGDQNDDNRS